MRAAGGADATGERQREHGDDGGRPPDSEPRIETAATLLNNGVHRGERLMSRQSVAMMTTNHLTPEQMAAGRPLLAGLGWGPGLAVTVAPNGAPAAASRYGWDGGYGTSWFDDRDRDLIAIVLTQTDNFLFNGGLAEFRKLI